MGDPLEKVQAGQRLEIPADAYNAFVDAGRAEGSRRHDVAQERTAKHGKLASSASATQRVRQGRYSILALREPIISPSDNLQEFKNRVSLDGEGTVAGSGEVRAIRDPARTIGGGIRLAVAS